MKGRIVLVVVALLHLHIHQARGACLRSLALIWKEGTATSLKYTCHIEMAFPQAKQICRDKEPYTGCTVQTIQTTAYSKGFDVFFSANRDMVCFGPTSQTTLSTVKYEEVDVIGKYVVTCTSSANVTNETEVVVRTGDANSNGPVFKEASIKMSLSAVPKITYVPLRVGAVVATDMNTGFNGLVGYSLISNRSPFSIGLNSGVVYYYSSTQGRVQGMDYAIKVMARDGGRWQEKTSTAVITVTLPSPQPACTKTSAVVELTTSDGTTTSLKGKSFIPLKCSDAQTYQIVSVNNLKTDEVAKYFKLETANSQAKVVIIAALPSDRYAYEIDLKATGMLRTTPAVVRVSMVIRGLKPECTMSGTISFSMQSPSCTILHPCQSPYKGDIVYSVTSSLTSFKENFKFLNLYGALELCKVPAMKLLTQDVFQITVNATIPKWTLQFPGLVTTSVSMNLRSAEAPPLDQSSPSAETMNDNDAVDTVVMRFPNVKGVLSLLMEPTCRPFFRMDQKTNQIKLRANITGLPLDKTKCSGYVWMKTSLGVSSKRLLSITIRDTNLPPVCRPMAPIHIRYMPTDGDTEVADLQEICSDPDFTKVNAVISCVISKGTVSQYFTLRITKLSIKLKDLPRDRSSYPVIIFAENPLSSPHLSTTMTITVKLEGLPPKCRGTIRTSVLNQALLCTKTISPCTAYGQGVIDYSIMPDTIAARNFSRMKITYSSDGIKICVKLPAKRNVTCGLDFKASVGGQAVQFRWVVQYSYLPPPVFSQKAYHAYIYCKSPTLKAGALITRVSAMSPGGGAITYSCLSCERGEVILFIKDKGEFRVRAILPDLWVTSRTVKARDSRGIESSTNVHITQLLKNVRPTCAVKYTDKVLSISDLHFGRAIGTLTCEMNWEISLHETMVQFSVQIQRGSYVSFAKQVLPVTLTPGRSTRLYATKGLPQKRASYSGRITVTSPAGAGAAAMVSTISVEYSVEVSVPLPWLRRVKVTGNTIQLRWEWMEIPTKLVERFVRQISKLQFSWRESSANGWQHTKTVPNTATGVTLESLKSNTVYLVSLKLFNIDSFYEPVESSKPLPFKTADPYLYEVILVDNQKRFTSALLDNGSEGYKSALMDFKVGGYMPMQQFLRSLKGLLSSIIKYFAKGSVVAAVNIALDKNVEGSRESIYATLRSVGEGGVKKITEQGKGSVEMLEISVLPHGTISPRRQTRSTSRRVILHEDKQAKVECAARVYGPEEPRHRWYIGKAKVLNISTTRAYFTRFQNDMGHYMSTLYVKKVKPRDSGYIKCHVELAPLSSSSRKISNSSETLVAVLPKPIMVITPLRVNIKAGASVTITCTATYPDIPMIHKGPFVRLRWKRGDEDIDERAAKISHTTKDPTRPSSTVTMTNIRESTKVTCVGENKAGQGEATSVITVSLGSTAMCKAEKDDSGILWSETAVGESDTQLCMKGYRGIATRRCVQKGKGPEWQRPNLVDCVSSEMQSIYDESVDLAEGIEESTLENTSGRLVKISGQDKQLTSGDLLKSVSIIENFVTAEEIRKAGTDLTEKNIIESASNILESKYKKDWDDVQEDNAGTPLLMKSVDKYGQIVSGRHVGKDWRVVPSKNIVLQTKKANVATLTPDGKNGRISFPDIKLPGMPDWTSDLNQVSLDVKSISGLFQDDEVGVSGLQYKTLNVMLPKAEAEANSTLEVNSDILALSLLPKKLGGVFDPPIRIKFQHINLNFSNSLCNFWDFSANSTKEMEKNGGGWSTSGCVKVAADSDNGSTICECTHLTNFAILMSPGGSKAHAALKYISWIGCGISLACLLATVIIYAVYWRHVKSDRSVVLLNLCVSLILALVTFLAGVERTENKNVCTAMAALLHFFFLAVFAFMLMEGVELYMLLVKVLSFGGSRKKWYILGGWGVPAVIVGISLGATQAKGYGNEDYCWLSIDNGLLWAFVVPALVIILINCVFLVLAMKAMFASKSMETKSTVNKAKQGVRGLCILMPLLGTTWVFGVLAVNDETVVFKYIFTVCNSLQGLFIFIFHSLMNKQLLKLWRKKGKGGKSSSSGTSAMKPRVKKPYGFSKKRAGQHSQERKTSRTTEDMSLGWSSGSTGNAFEPDPSLGVMSNPAFNSDDVEDSDAHNIRSLDHGAMYDNSPVNVNAIDVTVTP